MAKKLDIKVGDRFGKLTVVAEVTPRYTPCGTKRRRFLVRCDCGNEKVVGFNVFSSNKSQIASCGCSYDLASYTRKYTREQKESFLYTTWRGMKQRCYDSNSSNYKNYGGRGVRVCGEWHNDYISFYKWAMSNGASQELTLDRIDVNGNYEPSNCRWVSNSTQQRNKQYNRYIEYGGQRKLMKEWSEELGIPYDTIRARLDQYGYTVGQALEFEHYEPKIRQERPETRKAVLQYSLSGEPIKEWASLIDIQKELGFAIDSVRACCAGYSFSSHGFKWGYKDGVRENNKHNIATKPILQYTLEGVLFAEYPSARIASMQTGINASGIQKFCNGNKENHAHCGGYLWMYKNDENNPESIPALSGWTQYHRLTYNNKTICIFEWAQETGLRVTDITSRLERGWTIGEALGFEHHARKGSKYTRQILQYDKDMNLVREYRSLHFVRKETNRSKKTILRYLESGELDTRGYYWRYKEDAV